MPPSPPCPTCRQPLTPVGRFWICPEHGQVSLDSSRGEGDEAPSSLHPSSFCLHPLRIFLSYGHDDNEDLVRRIKADLEQRGHDVWFDRNDIKSGDDWRRAITDGIIVSQRVLSFLSKHSTRDPGVCLDEIAIAIGVKGGHIQTILVESELEVRPPPTVGHIQWLDMHDWKERKEHGAGILPEQPDSWETWYQAKLAEIIRVVESDESRRFVGEIETLSGHLKPIASDSRISTLLRKGFIGRKWLFDAIENWRNPGAAGPQTGSSESIPDPQSSIHDLRSSIPDPQSTISPTSRLFWITGDPGVGKSAFAAHLTHFGRDKVIAAQFVEWDKPDHRDARRVVRSLAFQLATRLPDYRKLLLTLPEIAELDRKDPAELFDYLLANPLKTVIGGGRERLLIVIDALDEAGESGRNPLVEMLARHAPRLPDWLGLVVTSRPESAVQTPLQGLNPFVLDTRTEANRADLRDFLHHQLFPQLQHRPDADPLIGQILKKCEGVFLYAERFCDEVQLGHLSLDRPDQFPQGLGGIFCQWFQRQFPDLEAFRKDIRPALRAILAARVPLPVEILQRLFNWQEDKLRDFTRILGALFPVTKEANGEVIKPCHKSLADWLGNADTGKAGGYFADRIEGHRMLGELGNRLYKHQPALFAGYLARHLPHHLCAARDIVGLLSVLAEPRLDYFEQWAEQGRAAEGLQCLEPLAEQLRASPLATDILPMIATQLARLHNRLGDADAAETWLRVALPAAPAGQRCNRTECVAWHELGSLELSRGAYDRAHTAFRNGLRIARRLHPALHAEVAANLIGLAVIGLLTVLNPNRVQKLGRLALDHAKEAKAPPHEAEACRVLADSLKDNLQYEAAADYLMQGEAIATRHSLTHSLLTLSTCRSWMTYQRAVLDLCSADDAEASFRNLLHLAEAARDQRFAGDAWSGLGQVAVLQRRASSLDQALRNLESFGQLSHRPHLMARRELLKAIRLHWLLRFQEAAQVYHEAADLSGRHGLWSRQADALIGKGAVLFHSGQTQNAEQTWRDAMTTLDKCPRARQVIAAKTLEMCRTSPTAVPL